MIKRYEEYICLVNKRLEEKFSITSVDIVEEAMKYSLFADGKRIRPLLCLEFSNICNGNISDALDYSCAVEMVHTYSLIHDDLPCMDDDDMRRGKPSCHIKFGEEYALLAGDALLTYAFETVAKCNNDSNRNIKAVSALSKCAGYLGMIGGQTLDLQNENKICDIDCVIKTDFLKTSKLIEAACVMGCISANADEKQIESAIKYSGYMGIAFQICDDILDVTSTSEVLGKPVLSDNENDKSTYVSLLGIDKAKKMADEYTFKALECLDFFGEKANDLKVFTKDLIKRKK